MIADHTFGSDDQIFGDLVQFQTGHGDPRTLQSPYVGLMDLDHGHIRPEGRQGHIFFSGEFSNLRQTIVFDILVLPGYPLARPNSYLKEREHFIGHKF